MEQVEAGLGACARARGVGAQRLERLRALNLEVCNDRIANDLQQQPQSLLTVNRLAVCVRVDLRLLIAEGDDGRRCPILDEVALRAEND